MKLLHIAITFLPERLGTAMRIYNLLSRLPWPVTLYVPDIMTNGTRVEKKHEVIENINVHRVPVEYHQGLRGHLPMIGAYYTWTRIPAKVTAAAAGTPMDLVIGHSPPMFGVEAQALAKRTEKPFIYFVHNVHTDRAIDERTPRDLLTCPYYYFTERRLFTGADHIVVLNRALKHRIQDIFDIPDNRFTIVPNGVDWEWFSPRPEYVQQANQIRRELGLSNQVILYAGYLDRINGIPDLAQVIPEILTQHPDVSFVFIGQGPEQKRIESLAEQWRGRVIHLTSVPHKAMPVYYQLCELFVIPRPSTLSAETITPIKLLEAMAMGRKVLCSDVGGLTELVDDGYNGFLFRKGDMANLKCKVVEAVRASGEEIGARAREKMVSEYSWQTASNTLHSCYSRVLREHSLRNGIG